jgi:hypothetical protein
MRGLRGVPLVARIYTKGVSLAQGFSTERRQWSADILSA